MVTRALLQKYREGKCSPQELEILSQYFAGSNNPELDKILDEDWERSSESRPEPDWQEPGKRILASLKNELHRERTSFDDGTPRNYLRTGFIRRWAAVAAAILLITGGGFLFWQQQASFRAVTLPENDLVVKRNDSETPLPFLLPDGSGVTLQPGSTLTYPREFEAGRRLVKLDGNAFFEVVRDSLQPFFVTTRALNVRVLGTSFNVFSQDDRPAEVSVVTGKVAVFLEEPKESIVLKPNERAVRLNTKAELTKVLATEPVPVRREAMDEIFDFQETPAARVFEAIAKAYDIRIRYDAEVIRNCTLRALLGDQPLFVKLDMICSPLGLTYEIEGTEIVIKGEGCHEDINQ